MEFHVGQSILNGRMNDNTNSTIDKKEVNPIHKKPFVLHIITRASWGGAQRYVYDVATDTKEYIQAVATETNGVLVDELRDQGVTVYPLSYSIRSIIPLYDLRTFFDIVNLLRRVKPDIVHLHSSKMGVLGSIASRMLGVKKIVFTVHGWPHNEKRISLVKFVFKTLSLITIMFSHKVIAVSNAVIKTRPFGLYKNKLTLIYPSITVPKYKDRPKAREVILNKTSFGKDDDFVLIGIVGELTRNKGHEVLIRAFKEVHNNYPNTRLICIGNGMLLPELRLLTRELDVDHLVAWIHELNDAAIFMKAFDIVVTASYTEAFGYVPLEAGLAGVARVATDVGGIPELIQNGVTGLLVPRDNARALVLALTTCIENKDLRDKLGHKAHESLETFTDLKKMRCKIYEIYEK